MKSSPLPIWFLLTVASGLFTGCDETMRASDKTELSVCPNYGFDNTQFCTALHRDMGRGPAAWGQYAKIWDKMDLSVTFLGGSPALQKRVMHEAKEWEKHCGIRFHFGSKPDSDLRVAFQCNGHWSYVGRDNRGIALNKATMNLQLTDWTEAAEVRRVVLHEFGHAIGLEHEHQHPEGEIKWNEPKVIAYYTQTQGWEEKETRFQVLRRSNSSNYLSTGVDSKSIMMYPIPAALTLDGYTTKWNLVLTQRDQQWVREAYPPRS